MGSNGSVRIILIEFERKHRMSGLLHRSSEPPQGGEWDGEGGKQDDMEVRLKLTSRHKQIEDLRQRLQKPKMLGKHRELKKACLGKRRPEEKRRSYSK